MNTYDIVEAAKLAKCHPDTLRKLAKAREVPATKVGRAWVFSESFNEWIDARCRSTAPKAAVTIGSESRSLAERLEERLERKASSKRRSSSSESENGSGDSTSSGTVLPFAGKRLPSDG